jgi:hypothetical protein
MASDKSREEKQVEVGQIWRNKTYNVSIKITRIIDGCQAIHKTFKGPVYTGVEFVVLSSDYTGQRPNPCDHSWKLGETVDSIRGTTYSINSLIRIWDRWDDIDPVRNWPELIQNDDYVKIEKKPGANCTSCKTHYPYADPDPNFKCWGCENGY